MGGMTMGAPEGVLTMAFVALRPSNYRVQQTASLSCQVQTPQQPWHPSVAAGGDLGWNFTC